jgi:RimJ/RimL family protein N-acetyltransferase
MDVDTSQLCRLRLRTPRLVLQLPGEAEAIALLELARSGIHPPEEMPFSVAWTDTLTTARGTDEFVDHYRHWRSRMRPERWALPFAVRAGGRLIGVQELHAEGFPQSRTVATRGWLGACFQRQGYGTEMRAAVLHLGFALGAERARSGYVAGNTASQRVSEKLGYVPIGSRTVTPRGMPRTETVLNLDRSAWDRARQVSVTLEGSQGLARALLGA